MEKKLSDYKHLYKYCEWKLVNDILLPELRSLSSLTQNELKQYEAIEGEIIIYTIIQYTYDATLPEKFRWLLSKSFDLFGLIDAGLAVEKTL